MALWSSITSIVEYQYWVDKIRLVFDKKWEGLKENLMFLEMAEYRADKNWVPF